MWGDEIILHIGVRIFSWEALLQRLANVHLTDGRDEFF
jgi:hypothetical protein